MKKNSIAVLLIIFLMACSSKKWDKVSIKEKCKKQLLADKDAKSAFTDDVMNKICDCMADKMVATYKTEAEAKADEFSSEEILLECTVSETTPKQ
jgi:hypothetical protein